MTTIAELERLLAIARAQEVSSIAGAGEAVDLSTAVDTFLLDCVAGGLAPNTVTWYRSILGLFVRSRDDGPLAAITTNDLRQYIASLQNRTTRYEGAPQRKQIAGGMTKQTVAGHVTGLHAFFKWAGKEYGIPNAMANVKRMRRPAPAPKAIASEDFRNLFDACGDDDAGNRNRALLAFLVDTGVRVSGLCQLTTDRLLMPDLQALVSEKGDKTRIVVYTKYTRALLALWLAERPTGSEYVFTNLLTGEPLTPSGVDQVLRRLKKTAGIKGRVNPHAFRHAFAREYLKAGGDAIRLAKLIGHSDVNTTAAYYAIFTPDELAKMHEDYSPLRHIMEAQ